MRILNNFYTRLSTCKKYKKPQCLVVFPSNNKKKPKHTSNKCKIGRKLLQERCREVTVATIIERSSGKFDYKLESGTNTFLCFRKTITSGRFKFSNLIDELNGLLKTDYVFYCSENTWYKLFETLERDWYRKQRNLTFHIRKKDSPNDPLAQKKCCMTAIKYIHRILEAEKMSYRYRPLLAGFQDNLSLTTLPSRYYKHRSLTINCKGLYISEKNAIKAVLTVKAYPNVIKADKETFEKMYEILVEEATLVVNNKDGSIFYQIGTHTGTIIDGTLPRRKCGAVVKISRPDSFKTC